VRRHLVVTGVALVVLVGAGAAVPVLTGDDAGPPCDGIVPPDLLDELSDGQGGYEQLWRHSRQLGRVECRVQGNGEGSQAGRVFITAVTAPNDVDAGLVNLYESVMGKASGLIALPEGLPGAAAFDDRFFLMPRCPALGRDAAGERRSMLAEVFVYPSASWDTRLRMAVAAVNAAAQELGCGAQPLSVPDRRVAEPPETVPLRDAEGTCGVLTSASLPRLPGGEQWRLMAAATRSSPFPICTLWGDGPLSLAGWYGDWSNAVRAQLLPYEEEAGGPLLESWASYADERGGYATATCDGQPAVFAAETEYSSSSEALTVEHIRDVLALFATEQAERRGCTGLRLPGQSGQE
jgi:hypothetical protein